MTAKMLVAVTSLTVVVASAGCATENRVDYTPVNPAPRALQRRSPESVGVFVGAPPVRAHVDVGVFDVYQGDLDSGRGRSTGDMLETLKMHGSLRGCDAIAVLGIELAGRYSTRVIHAVCEVYTDEEARREADRMPSPPALPGEGRSCSEGDVAAHPMQMPIPCPSSLACEKHLCVSPY